MYNYVKPQYTATFPSKVRGITVGNVTTCSLMCRAEMNTPNTCAHIMSVFLLCLIEQIS